MHRRDDQERIASADSEMRNAGLAEIVDSAEVEIGVVILTEW